MSHCGSYHYDYNEDSDGEESYDDESDACLVREEHLELVRIMLELCDSHGQANSSAVASSLRERDPDFFTGRKFKTLILEAHDEGAPVTWDTFGRYHTQRLLLTGFAKHWAILVDVLCDMQDDDGRVEASRVAQEVRARDAEPDFWCPTQNRKFKDMVIEASENGAPVEWITDWGTYVKLVSW